MPTSLIRLGRAAALFAVLACGGSSDATTGLNAAACNGTNFITASIDGAAWCSNAGVEATGIPLTLPGVYAITGTQVGSANPYVMSILLFNIGATGTYPLGVSPQVPGGAATLSSTSGGWSTAQTGADGSITITTLTSSRMEGTFTFTAGPLSGGAAGTRSVTNGKFALNVKPTGTVGALAANAGSSVTGTIGGTTYTAAAASGTLSLASGFMVVASSNSIRTVTINLAGVTGTGTYAFGTNRSMGVTNVTSSSSNMWSSAGAGSSGSVVIASIASSRMQGTFSGTLGPAPGSTTSGPIQVSGAFSVGLLQPP